MKILRLRVDLLAVILPLVIWNILILIVCNHLISVELSLKFNLSNDSNISQNNS